MLITDIIHPEDLESFKGKRILDDIEGQITRNIIRYRHKNGQYVYLEWSSEYFSIEENYIIAARDITNRLEIENKNKKLEQVVKLEIAKNEFFSNISHEFRTPINILLGTTQVLNKNIENNNIKLENLKKYSNYIRQNAYRLLRLVNNLIDINKMDMGAYNLRCSNQNIVNIIEDITLSVADYTKNNNINLVFDTDKEEIITYAKKLQEIGARNVIISMAGDGAILIEENGEITISDTPKGTLVNSVGAGDSMVGGFLAGIAEDKNIKEAFKMGVATGSASAFSEGLATKDKVEELLKQL